MRRAAAVLALVAAGCGGGGSAGGPDDTVRAYLAALGRGDAKGTCAQLTRASRTQLGQFGAQRLHAPDDTCESTIRLLLSSPAGASLKRLAHAKVGAVRTKGPRAAVSVAGVDRAIALERHDGQWLIASQPTGELD